MVGNKSTARSLVFVMLCMGLFLSSTQLHGVELRVTGGQPANDGSGTILLAQDDECTVKVVYEHQADQLEIEGLNDATAFTLGAQQRSQQHFWTPQGMNSQVTTSYNVTPLVLGEHAIGPARITTQGRTYESNVVLVKVLDAATFDRMFSGQHVGAGLSCKVVVDQPEVVVSQDSTITVVAEGGSDVLKYVLQPPSFGSLSFSPVGEARTEQRVVNGQVRTFITQQFSARADTPGNYTIGPAIAHFVLPDDQRGHDPFRALMGFGAFGGGGKKRSVRSNSVQLTVKELPVSDLPTDGIGQFSTLTLSCDKRTVELNEPFPVRLAVTGSGNFGAMPAPELRVPHNMNVFDATSSFTPQSSDQGAGTKTFEYLLQIEESGSHHIPAQSFSYYNTATEQHETLRSQALIVEVKPGRVTTAPHTLLPQAEEEEGDDDEPEEAVYFDDEVTQVRGGAHGFGVGLLILMMLVPFLYLGRRRIQQLIARVSELLGISSQEKRDIAALNRLVAEEKVTELHRFFSMVLNRHEVVSAPLDGTFAQKKARAWQWDNKREESFIAFIEGCNQAAFAPQLLSDNEKKALLSRASYWHSLIVQESKK